jgi:hypothetical protein
MGAANLLKRQKPTVLVETTELKKVSDLLFGLGYECFFIHDRNFLSFTEYLPQMSLLDQHQAHLPRNKQPYTNNFLFFPVATMTSQLREAIQHRLYNHA